MTRGESWLASYSPCCSVHIAGQVALPHRSPPGDAIDAIAASFARLFLAWMLLGGFC